MKLIGVKLREIMEAAGCAKGYASVLRRGVDLPHVSTWRQLATLAGVPVDAPGAETVEPVAEPGRARAVFR